MSYSCLFAIPGQIAVDDDDDDGDDYYCNNISNPLRTLNTISSYMNRNRCRVVA